MTATNQQGEQFAYDVFLSHNQADKPRVRQLAERLPLQFGTRNSELGIARLCLSPTALGSDWVTLERSAVLFRDPSNAGRRLIPPGIKRCVEPRTKTANLSWDSAQKLSNMPALNH
jgi:hypothetical protein